MYKNIAGVHNISLRFGENILFSGFSLDIPAGQVTGLSGPSGRGKTTLLRILSGFCEPDSGDIVRNYSRHAYVFQDHRLFPWMSSLENIALPLRKKHGEKSADIAVKYLERVHLKNCRHEVIMIIIIIYRNARQAIPLRGRDEKECAGAHPYIILFRCIPAEVLHGLSCIFHADLC